MKNPICTVVFAILLAAAPSAAQQSRYGLDDVLDHASASAGALSPDGRWLVVSTASLRDRLGTDNHRFADPTYVAPSVAGIAVVDTRDGSVQPVFPDKRQVRSFAWSPDGSRLAFVWRDGEVFRPAVWERATRRLRTLATPAGTSAADNTSLQWSEDGAQLYLATRSEQWRHEARRRFEREVRGPVVVMSSSEPFLSWDDVRRWPLRQGVAAIDVAAGRARQVLADTLLRGWEVTDGHLRYHVDITTKTDYENIGGSESRILVRALSGGEARVLVPTTRGVSPTWSGDGRSYVFTRDNRIWMATLADSTPRFIAGPVPGAPSPADSAARAQAARERLTTVRLSHDGSALIGSNRAGLWLVDTRSGERELFHASPGEEGDSLTAPRFSVVEWSRDGNVIYLTYAARDRWERGLFRYDRDTKRMRELVRDSRRYAGWRLSEDGSTLIFTVAEGALPGDIHAADADFTRVRRLTETSARLAGLRPSRTQLVDYLDADGTRLHGVLYYPVDYEEGRRYPTVFIVYESFFDDGFNSTVALLTANGYAVMQPSVRLETGFPGEAWLKGVTAAANRLIEMGVADGDRMGVHGTSYGGYATNLLITQTQRFKAAINISGKVNMISFYTDSPRLGVRNIHAPERSQDRIGATLWEQPQKYIAHSAIMFADRIRTPLLLMTGQQDHNVPERTTMEMYYALRRLGREVEWVSYVNGGHGMPTTTAEEVIDYHQRILGWYDRWLKPKPKAEQGAAVIPSEARQLVVVVTPAWDSIRGELHRFERPAGGAWRRADVPVPVVLGRTGLAWGLGFESWAEAGARQAPVKREGDGRSPAGVYAFAQAFGFAPVDSTGLRLPYLPLTERTECVDDTASAHYNAVLERDAVVVDWKSSERMRSIAQYRRGAIVAYNPTPAARSRGSCIFLHIWRTAASPTAGCTALEPDQLEDVLRWLDPAHRPLLVQLPAGAYAELRERWGLPAL